MSEPASKFDEFGLDRDPFSTTIADEEIASQYSIVGRDDQEYRLREFVKTGIRDPDHMKRRLIFGEYGTGKSHHLIELRDEVREGVEVDGQTYDALAVYVSNLGLSIRRLYEKIVDELVKDEPGLEEYIDSLGSIEPANSVDEAYQYERLQDNITTHLRKIVSKARDDFGYRAVFLFIDEAEDIATEQDQKVQQFIRSFLHLVNELNTSGLHILLGFSQGARIAITDYEDDEDALGNALVQRFQGDDIYLGDLTEQDVKAMLIDRMDVHRTSNRGELHPIVEETVGVVTEVTGGHPRSILQIYSDALNYASDIDADRIDGDTILYALRDFKSLLRDEVLLSGEALTSLQQALEEAHPEARNDFERLQGRLIGEAEEVAESAFTEGVPDELISPITVEGDDARELRVLEKRTEHGRYSYVLSDEAKDFLFRGKSEEGTELQKLDLQAQSAPKKYQGELSRGLALSIRDTQRGSLHKDPVTVTAGRYEYAVYLIDVDRGAGKRDQTVAVGVYNGQEIPAELVKLYVDAHNSRGVDFGALVKENQQLSGDARKFLNELDDQDQQFYSERIVEVNLTTSQRDNLIYGRLLALGDSDVDSEGMVDSQQLVEEIGLMGDLEQLFAETILPYPDKVHRDVIDHLEANDNGEFTIGNLRDEKDIADFNLNSDIMGGLRAENLVAKSGQRWTYPDIENDKPPWYQVYRIVNEKGALTVDEILQQLTLNFVLGCPQGDEHSMLQWYLDHLQRQNYLESTTTKRDGSTIDAYNVVSVENQFSEARSRAESRTDTAQDLYEEADSLGAANINRYENDLNDLEVRLEEYEEVFNPEHEDLNEVRTLTEEIVELEEDLETALEERKDKIKGDAVSVQDSIDDLRQTIAKADVEGAFGSQLESYDEELAELDDELATLVDNEQYERLLSRTGKIKDRVEDIEQEVDRLAGVKTKATDLFKNLRDTADSAEDHIENIATENDTRTELSEELERIESLFTDYRSEFNDGEIESALETLQQIEPDVESLEEQARAIEAQQREYLTQLDDLEPELNDSESQELLAEARETVRKGDFATAPALIDDLRDRAEGPTRREKFLSSLTEHGGSMTSVIRETDFDEAEAFKQLSALYGESESRIVDISVEMSDE